jgi:hypothetical protein
MITPILFLMLALSPQASPSPTPPPSLPSDIPSALPTAEAPSPAPSQWPARPTMPPLNYRFIPRPAATIDPAQPVIHEIDINEKTVHDQIAIRVVTSENVVKVTSSSNGRTGTITQVGPGEFEVAAKLPKVPFAWNFTLLFVATTADGHSTSVKVPLKVK